MPEVRHTNVYVVQNILVSMGGGITGDEQVNDTHAHHPLKGHYWVVESELMLQKLTEEIVLKLPTLIVLKLST